MSYHINYIVRDSTEKIRFQVDAEGTSATVGDVDYTMAVGEWHHLAVAYNSAAGTAKLYVATTSDHLLIGTYSSLDTSIFDGTAAFHLGGDNGRHVDNHR